MPPLLSSLFHISSIEQLAIPAVSFLIFFLAYTSQFLFYYIDPAPLLGPQFWWFNISVLAIWWCYYKACTVDPGPKGWVDRVGLSAQEEQDGEVRLEKGMRWCKKCKAVKPPRAHHCRQCGRCIPKMDHHCPWTTNCVSHTNFPHFIRFVLYAVLSMSILAYHLFVRAMALWENRNLPAYLGPPIWALAHLFILIVTNSLTLFALFILLTRAIYSLATNTSQIESWEIERHEALVGRAKKNGGYLWSSAGKMRIERQEFPYDVGIWRNISQAMGTGNPLMWVLPFGGAPDIKQAVEWEVNGFEDEDKTWPPPDPDKVPRSHHNLDSNTDVDHYGSVAEEKEAFRRRQREDFVRRRQKDDDDGTDDDEVDYDSEYEEGLDGEPGWTNSDGDRLRDYGVDEETEDLAEDDIPLGELLRRRKRRAD